MNAMDHIKAIEDALAAGPTSGPFVVFNDAVYRAADVDEEYPVVHVCSSQFMEQAGSLVAVDAAWFAACHPEAIRSLLDRLREAEARTRPLVEALERLIANRDKNYWKREEFVTVELGSYWAPHATMVDSEVIAHARAALAAYKEQTK